MTLERLYTPWRLAYVTGAAKSSDCVFCTAQHTTDADALIVLRGSACFIILNLFPYNNGHLMVVPNRHIATLVDARPEELHEMMEFTRLGEIALREAFEPHGLNVGINLGKAAGAGILEHLHIHLVPRWTRRHELHDHHRPDARAAAGAAGDRRSACARSSSDSPQSADVKSPDAPGAHR